MLGQSQKLGKNGPQGAHSHRPLKELGFPLREMGSCWRFWANDSKTGMLEKQPRKQQVKGSEPEERRLWNVTGRGESGASEGPEHSPSTREEATGRF